MRFGGYEMRERMEKILQRHGMAVDVWHDGTITRVKAFFQPVIARIAREISTPLGMAPLGKFHYFGPAEQEIDVDDEVILAGVNYVVIRAEEIRDDQGIVYRWAVCRRSGGQDTWVNPI